MATGGLEELLLPTLDVNNIPVVWSQAVDEYLHNPALVPLTHIERGRTVCAECGCEEFDQPYGGGPFTTPSGDGMPWVAADRPETNDFLGVRVKPGTEMALRGLITRDGADNWSSGVVGCGKATLTAAFQVVGLTTKAVRFGYNWFQAMVRSCSEPCDDSTLTVWLWCDQAASSGRRFLRQARVVEFTIDDQDPHIHACEAIDVNVSWEIEDPRLFLAPQTLVDTTGSSWNIDMASSACDGCQPSTICSPGEQGLVAVNVEQARELRPVELRGDKTWCPIGNYALSDLQLFGGRELAYPGAYTAVDPVKIPCDPCSTYGIRLVWRQDFPDGDHFEFQTVRWANGLWESQSTAGIPCGCPIEVVELLHLHHIDEGTPPVPVLHRDLVSYSGKASTDGECCLVKLRWTSPVGGTFSSMPPPWATTSAQRTGWSPNLPNENLFEAASGWPPIGCTLTIARDECREPQVRDLGTCSDTNGQIRLHANGTWEPLGWEHKITATPWPPLGRNIVIVDQLTNTYIIQELLPAVDADCVPGGSGHSHGVPPLWDPLLGEIATVDWCMTSTVCAYPVTIPAFGSEKLGTVIVTVAAGAAELKWLRWAIWEKDPLWGDFTTPASRANYRSTDPLFVGEVPILAPGQQVIFDGQQDRIMLNCAAGIIESEQAGFGPFGMFAHPVFAGNVEHVFAMLPHPWATPTDASYKVQLVEWELP